jgi:hypothetical protein
MNDFKHFEILSVQIRIQGESECVLILTSGRTRQFMKLFSITFCKIRKSFPRFFAPQFLPNDENLNFHYLLFSVSNNVTFFTKLRFYHKRKFSPLPIGGYTF